MKKGEKEARIGLDSEKKIVEKINSDEVFRNSLKECLVKLGFGPKNDIKAQRNNLKTDILIRIDGNIGASVKTSTRTSFHQLDRRSLEDWKELLSMSDEVFEIMKEAILRVAKNERDEFILEKDRPKISNFFATHLRSILEEIFMRGEKDLQLLMIINEANKKVYVFRMTDVINFIYEDASRNISFSKKGIIRLGNFITIQRKGGDGKHVTIPKTCWKHPGNQLQFKFSPLKFVKCVEETKTIEFCTISY